MLIVYSICSDLSRRRLTPQIRPLPALLQSRLRTFISSASIVDKPMEQHVVDNDIRDCRPLAFACWARLCGHQSKGRCHSQVLGNGLAQHGVRPPIYSRDYLFRSVVRVLPAWAWRLIGRSFAVGYRPKCGHSLAFSAARKAAVSSCWINLNPTNSSRSSGRPC